MGIVGLTQTPSWSHPVVELSNALRATLTIIRTGTRATEIEKLLEKITILHAELRLASRREILDQIEPLMRQAEAVARRAPISLQAAEEELHYVLQRREELGNALESLSGVPYAEAARASLRQQLVLLEETRRLASIRLVTAKVSKDGKLVASLLQQEKERLQEVLIRIEDEASQAWCLEQLSIVKNLQDMHSGFVWKEFEHGTTSALVKARKQAQDSRDELYTLIRNALASRHDLQSSLEKLTDAERRLELLEGEAYEYTAALHAPS